ncbi:MAG: roadblock/LC7 domain-containing protein [Caldisericia bacterium]|nr:roadblock/LC7 domain-containing protein [Caldisericia bacterium]
MSQPRISEIKRIVDQIASSNPDIIGCALVSEDGLPVYSAVPSDIEEDIVSAMSATLYALGERIISDLISGGLKQVYIKGDKGYVVVSSVDELGTLTVLAKSSAKLGFVLMVLRQVITELLRLI